MKMEKEQEEQEDDECAAALVDGSMTGEARCTVQRRQNQRCCILSNMEHTTAK